MSQDSDFSETKALEDRDTGPSRSLSDIFLAVASQKLRISTVSDFIRQLDGEIANAKVHEVGSLLTKEILLRIIELINLNLPIFLDLCKRAKHRVLGVSSPLDIFIPEKLLPMIDFFLGRKAPRFGARNRISAVLLETRALLLQLFKVTDAQKTPVVLPIPPPGMWLKRVLYDEREDGAGPDTRR